jgi:hypothetical protein
MTKEAIAELSLADIEYADEAHMTVRLGGKATSWVWTFAGPGHPQTVAMANRQAREAIDRERSYIDPEDTLEQRRLRNVNMIADRLLGWSPVKLDGEVLSFSPDAARKLLLDPRKGQIFLQALQFLGHERSFTKGSATA